MTQIFEKSLRKIWDRWIRDPFSLLVVPHAVTVDVDYDSVSHRLRKGVVTPVGKRDLYELGDLCNANRIGKMFGNPDYDIGRIDGANASANKTPAVRSSSQRQGNYAFVFRPKTTDLWWTRSFHESDYEKKWSSFKEWEVCAFMLTNFGDPLCWTGAKAGEGDFAPPQGRFVSCSDRGNDQMLNSAIMKQIMSAPTLPYRLFSQYLTSSGASSERYGNFDFGVPSKWFSRKQMTVIGPWWLWAPKNVVKLAATKVLTPAPTKSQFKSRGIQGDPAYEAAATAIAVRLPALLEQQSSIPKPVPAWPAKALWQDKQIAEAKKRIATAIKDDKELFLKAYPRDVCAYTGSDSLPEDVTQMVIAAVQNAWCINGSKKTVASQKNGASQKALPKKPKTPTHPEYKFNVKYSGRPGSEVPVIFYTRYNVDNERIQESVVHSDLQPNLGSLKLFKQHADKLNKDYLRLVEKGTRPTKAVLLVIGSPSPYSAPPPKKTVKATKIRTPRAATAKPKGRQLKTTADVQALQQPGDVLDVSNVTRDGRVFGIEGGGFVPAISYQIEKTGPAQVWAKPDSEAGMMLIAIGSHSGGRGVDYSAHPELAKRVRTLSGLLESVTATVSDTGAVRLEMRDGKSEHPNYAVFGNTRRRVEIFDLDKSDIARAIDPIIAALKSPSPASIVPPAKKSKPKKEIDMNKKQQDKVAQIEATLGVGTVDVKENGANVAVTINLSDPIHIAANEGRKQSKVTGTQLELDGLLETLATNISTLPTAKSARHSPPGLRAEKNNQAIPQEKKATKGAGAKWAVMRKGRRPGEDGVVSTHNSKNTADIRRDKLAKDENNDQMFNVLDVSGVPGTHEIITTFGKRGVRMVLEAPATSKTQEKKAAKKAPPRVQAAPATTPTKSAKTKKARSTPKMEDGIVLGWLRGMALVEAKRAARRHTPRDMTSKVIMAVGGADQNEHRLHFDSLGSENLYFFVEKRGQGVAFFMVKEPDLPELVYLKGHLKNKNANVRGYLSREIGRKSNGLIRGSQKPTIEKPKKTKQKRQAPQASKKSSQAKKSAPTSLAKLAREAVASLDWFVLQSIASLERNKKSKTPFPLSNSNSLSKSSVLMARTRGLVGDDGKLTELGAAVAKRYAATALAKATKGIDPLDGAKCFEALHALIMGRGSEFRTAFSGTGADPNLVISRPTLAQLQKCKLIARSGKTHKITPKGRAVLKGIGKTRTAEARKLLRTYMQDVSKFRVAGAQTYKTKDFDLALNRATRTVGEQVAKDIEDGKVSIRRTTGAARSVTVMRGDKAIATVTEPPVGSGFRASGKVTKKGKQTVASVGLEDVCRTVQSRERKRRKTQGLGAKATRDYLIRLAAIRKGK